jgi:hypothetical protein
MTTLRATTILLMLCSFGCGDDDGAPATSGVNGSARVADLGDPDVMQFCVWFVDLVDGPREVTCPDDVTITFPSVDECVADYGNVASTCEMTVSQAEACARAVAADNCAGFGNSACQPLFECAFQ